MLVREWWGTLKTMANQALDPGHTGMALNVTIRLRWQARQAFYLYCSKHFLVPASDLQAFWAISCHIHIVYSLSPYLSTWPLYISFSARRKKVEADIWLSLLCVYICFGLKMQDSGTQGVLMYFGACSDGKRGFWRFLFFLIPTVSSVLVAFRKCMYPFNQVWDRLLHWRVLLRIPFLMIYLSSKLFRLERPIANLTQRKVPRRKIELFFSQQCVPFKGKRWKPGLGRCAQLIIVENHHFKAIQTFLYQPPNAYLKHWNTG